ncbi:MAG: hypothetical protein R3D57_10795 [Hyphomicrobiaceae bacterium]
MIGKMSLAAAIAGAILLAAPISASAASLSQAATVASPKVSDNSTVQVHRKKWRKWHKHRRHVRKGRYYNYRYYRPRYYSYQPYYYYGYSPYYVYRPYRHSHRYYRRHHRPHFGIYLSF